MTEILLNIAGALFIGAALTWVAWMLVLGVYSCVKLLHAIRYSFGERPEAWDALEDYANQDK